MTYKHGIFKTSSEKWVYELLKKVGYSDKEIIVPDKYNRNTSDIDFLIPDLAIEVKELVPSKDDVKEEKKIKQEILSGLISTYKLPSKISAFKRCIRGANKKFKKYQQKPTLLIIDMEWGFRNPDVDTLIFGIQQLHLPSETTSWTNRIVRLDTVGNISAIMAKYDNQLNIYYTDRQPNISVDFINKLKSYVPDTNLFEFDIVCGAGENVIIPMENKK